MDSLNPEKYLREIPEFHKTSQAVSRGIHNWVMEGGKPRRRLADLLHGVWLGHPLHPVLTDVTIGAWMAAGLLDLISIGSRSRNVERAADQMLAIGNASAVPTALAGLVDFTTIPRRAISTGGAHGLLNVLGLVINLFSTLFRRTGNRSAGVFLSSLSLGLLGVSGFLGGELSFKMKVGVNKSETVHGPLDWAVATSEANLPEGKPYRVTVEGAPVLLYRYGGAIYAIGNTCGHDGGPLDEGKFDGLCVECPWHQSVFDLRDGSVVHGPSTYAAVAYDTRVVNGNVQIRLREAPPRNV